VSNNNNNNRFTRREDNIKMVLVDVLLVVCEMDSFDSGWGPEVRSCGPGTAT
jgi:hypothetical protein